MSRRWLLPLIAIVLWTSAPRAWGQALTVQQPSVESIGVGTTVSVPDRGRTLLGGVSSGAASRSIYGPLPMNSNRGQAFQAGSISTSVTIIDFEEMDRAALEAAEGRRPISSGKNSNREYQLMLARNAKRMPKQLPQVVAGSPTDEPPRSDDHGDRQFQLGSQAEARGNLSVARLHYRQAVKRGSSEAARQLAELDRSTPQSASRK